MPTARELLEQADALMRRNRARDQAPVVPGVREQVVEDDVPELTEVAPAPAAVVLPAPEPAPPESPEAGSPVVPDAGEASAAAQPSAMLDEAGAPVLREALARELASPAVDYPPPMPAAPVTLDDIPELTEIVEEIEAPSILDESVDFEMGEPSVWMEPGHGEVSILGRWPEVPEEVAAQAGDAGEDSVPDAGTADGTEVGVLHVAPDLLDAALAAALPSADVLARVDSAAASPGLVDDLAAVEAPAPSADADDEQGPAPQDDAAAGEAVERDAPALEDVADAGTGTVMSDIEAASAVASGSTVAGSATAAGAPSVEEAADAPPAGAPAQAFELPRGEVGAAPAASSAAPSGDVPAAGVAAETDAERWDRLAEEVRMQVLQRIDIFTDTGLQEQLARRLQPLVDRASADLVVTINHHVGALMRAYVAEAIEREIEKWRADSR